MNPLLHTLIFPTTLVPPFELVGLLLRCSLPLPRSVTAPRLERLETNVNTRHVCVELRGGWYVHTMAANLPRYAVYQLGFVQVYSTASHTSDSFQRPNSSGQSASSITTFLQHVRWFCPPTPCCPNPSSPSSQFSTWPPAAAAGYGLPPNRGAVP